MGSRERASYGTPHVGLGAHRQQDGPTTDLPYQSNVCARIRPTLPTTNRDGVSFHSDCIPLPPTSWQVSAGRVRQARWCGPELPGVFRADSVPQIGPIATVSASTAIAYPYPRRPGRSALAESGKHGGVDPNFPAYSGRTRCHPIRLYAFTQVTGLGPQALKFEKSAAFRYPY